MYSRVLMTNSILHVYSVYANKQSWYDIDAVTGRSTL